MSSPVNLVSLGCFNQPIHYPDAKKILDFLSHKINEIFHNTNQTVQPIELAKELFTAKRKNVQETEETLKGSSIKSIFDENAIKVFSLCLHRFSGDLIQEGLKYIKNAPGYHPQKGFHVPCSWEKSQTVALRQIYRDQFSVWMLDRAQMSFDSVLQLLQIFHSFDTPFIQLPDEVWSEFHLQISEKQKQLKEFRCKYKFLQNFPIDLPDIGIVCDLQVSKRGSV